MNRLTKLFTRARW